MYYNLYDVLLFILVFPLLIIKLLVSLIFDLLNNNNNNTYKNNISFNENDNNSNIESVFAFNGRLLNSHNISNILFTSGLIVCIISIATLTNNNNKDNYIDNEKNNIISNDSSNNIDNNFSLDINVENIDDANSNKSNNSPYYIANETNNNFYEHNENHENDDNISIDSETLLLEETNIKMKKLAITNKNILIGWYVEVNEDPSYCGEIIALKKRVLRSTLFIIKLDDSTQKEVSLKRIDGDKIKGEVDFTLIRKLL